MKGISQYKNFFVSIIIMVVFAFVIKNMFVSHSIKIKGLEAKREELKKGIQLIEQWEIINKEYENTVRDFFTKDPSLFKKFVEEQLQNNRVNIGYLSPSRRDLDFYWEVGLSLRGGADSYENVVNFAKSLEEKTVIIDVMRLRRNPDGKKGIDINLRSIILKE